jgi:hypothetical protein
MAAVMNARQKLGAGDKSAIEQGPKHFVTVFVPRHYVHAVSLL